MLVRGLNISHSGLIVYKMQAASPWKVVDHISGSKELELRRSCAPVCLPHATRAVLLECRLAVLLSTLDEFH